MMNDLDKWYQDEVADISDNNMLVCIKLLERQASKSPIGNAGAFTWLTMHQCVEVALELASDLVRNPAIPVWERFEAQAVVLAFARIWNYQDLDTAQIRNILQLPIRDRDSAKYAIKLVELIVDDSILFDDLSDEVISAVNLIKSSLGLPDPTDENLAGIKRALRLAQIAVYEAKPGAFADTETQPNS
ncbi:MAG TPA: hypothetical protein VGK19_09345 [Capsulimonadaceae bacterium]|jgi:hypothetical protein